jgi:hypothetical protein
MPTRTDRTLMNIYVNLAQRGDTFARAQIRLSLGLVDRLTNRPCCLVLIAAVLLRKGPNARDVDE